MEGPVRGKAARRKLDRELNQKFRNYPYNPYERRGGGKAENERGLRDKMKKYSKKIAKK